MDLKKKKKNKIPQTLHRRPCKQVGFSVQRQPIIGPICGQGTGNKKGLKRKKRLI